MNISLKEKLSENISRSRAAYGLFALCGALFLLLFKLMSFAVLQSDDYYYASFLNDGLLNFLSLTRDHFINVNGRAFVHFFIHIVLRPPTFVYALAAAFVLLSLSFAAASYFRIFRLGAKDAALFTTLFFMSLFLLPVGQLKETLLWVSGFFNYVFPALAVFLCLIAFEKNHPSVYPLALLSGFTTEQWGITAFFMLALFSAGQFCDYLSRAPRTKKGALKKGVLSPFVFAKHAGPVFLALLGVSLIFLSPATRGRLAASAAQAGSPATSFLLLSTLVFSESRSVIIPLVFVLASASLAVFYRRYLCLVSGAVPALLMLLSLALGFPEKLCCAAFLCLLLYLVLVFVRFFLSPLRKISPLILGAVVSLIVMLSAGTFEPRVTFPAYLLLSVASISCVIVLLNENSSLRMRKSLFYPPLALVLLVFSLVSLFPSYMGFRYNHKIEEENISAVKAAHVTKEYHYNIDYDKKYAMLQMFNDGWFYTNFISLYNLNDCKIIFESDTLSSILCRGKPTGAVAPTENGTEFLPVRPIFAFLGGSIENYGKKTVLSLRGRTLTYEDGILTYTDKNGKIHYETADEHKSLTFYTLSLDREILTDAFSLKITQTGKTINVE